MGACVKTDERYEKLRSERRFVTVSVDVNIFGTMLLRGIDHTITVDGLPEDAIFVTAERETQSQPFGFIYLHESFEQVPEGSRAPIQFVTLTRHDNEKS